MLASILFHALFLALFVLSWCSWTTITPYPRTYHANGGTAIAVGELVVTIDNTETHILNAITGVWTTKAQLPFNRYDGCGAYLRRLGVLMVSGQPLSPPKNIAYILETDRWTTVTAQPTSRVVCGAASNKVDTLWLVGGLSAQNTVKMEVFDLLADLWTSLAQFPTTKIHVSSGYDNQRVIVTASNPFPPLTMVYHVLQDSWTTALPMPTPHHAIYDNMATVAQFVYVSPGIETDPAGSSVFERYDSLLDAWTILEPFPASVRIPMVAVTDSGLYVAVGSWPHVTSCWSYRTGFTASITGDPLFSTFDGRSFHLSLRTGVFAVFASPTLVVNVLVDVQPWLPPEEDLMVAMVGVVAVSPRGDPIAITCSASGECLSHGDVRAGIVMDKHSMVYSHHNGMRVTVLAESIALSVNHTAFAPSQHYDVKFSSELPVRGLIGDLDTLGAIATQPKISDYEVLNGCLMAPAVVATQGVFGGADLYC